jgi:hypothetical protein
MYFIGGLAKNMKMRRRAAIFFMDNFDEVCASVPACMSHMDFIPGIDARAI